MSDIKQDDTLNKNTDDMPNIDVESSEAEEAALPSGGFVPEEIPVADENSESEQETDDGEEEFKGVFIADAKKATISFKSDGRITGVHVSMKDIEHLRLLNIPPSKIDQLPWMRDKTVTGLTEAEKAELTQDIGLASIAAGGKELDPTVYRAAEWSNMVADEKGQEIGLATPNIQKRKNVPLADKVAARIGQKTGLGRTVTVPLWESGIWITLKAPLLGEELEFYRRLGLDRVIVGRATYGQAFTNDRVIINRNLVDFIFQHTLETSLPGATEEELLKIIKLTDLQAMALGLASTIYVHGFPFRQPCITNIEKCRHVEVSSLNLPKLLWVDNKKVTPYQRQLMAKRGSKVTMEQLETYQEAISGGTASFFHLDDWLTVEFKVPTLAEHFDVGEAWINDISAAADIAFGKNLSVEARNDYLLQQSQLSRIRSHSHWIKSIKEIVDTPNGPQEEVYLPGGPMERILTQLSGDPGLSEKLIDAIYKFSAECQRSVVGIPNYDCPACGAFHTDERGVSHAIHPLDAVSVFFQMQQFRLTKHLTPTD